MNLLRGTRVVLTAALLGLALPSAQSAPPSSAGAPVSTGSIPKVDATTLTGVHVRLPDDLARQGSSAVLILGFSKAARDQARDWGKRLSTDYQNSTAVRYFEMPVLASVPRLMRGFVLRSISSEVSDRGKPHFLPITTDEPRWRDLAHYSDPDAAYILLVNPAGSVVWQTSGPLTEAAYTTLHQQLVPPAR